MLLFHYSLYRKINKYWLTDIWYTVSWQNSVVFTVVVVLTDYVHMISCYNILHCKLVRNKPTNSSKVYKIRWFHTLLMSPGFSLHIDFHMTISLCYTNIMSEGNLLYTQNWTALYQTRNTQLHTNLRINIKLLIPAKRTFTFKY